MNERHIIGEAVFDISFDSTEIAREQESELGFFIQNRLLTLADEILCELSPDGMVSRIDLLEIDLGDVSYYGFQEEIESRFREKFRSVLLEKIESVRETPSSTEGVFSKQYVERSQLERFLETGRMLLDAETGGGATIDEMLQRSVRDGKETFVEFLKKTPHRDIVVQRLSKQFPDKLLAAVMHLLAPAHASFLGSLIQKFRKPTGERFSFNGVTENQLKSMLWERLISDILKSGNSDFDPEKRFREITGILLAQYAKHEKVSGAQLADAYAEGEFTIRLLTARLDAAMVAGRAGELSGSWDEICQSHADLVREVFTRRMGEERLRKKLAEGFPEGMLHDLIRILVPWESSFIEALVKQPELQISKAGAASTKNTFMWECTLDYLHTALASGYDRNDYVRKLLSCLSGQGMAQTEIYLAITRADPALGKELSMQLHQARLAGETGKNEIVLPNAETSGIRRAEELYQRLVRRLGNRHQEVEMVREIEELASAYPAILSRFYRQLKSGEIRANVAGLTAGEARQLVRSQIGLNQAGGDFMRAVETHAKIARNEQSYYQHILEKLIHNQVVDLEEAARVADGIKVDDESFREFAPLSSRTVVKTESGPLQSTRDMDKPENREPVLLHDELLRTRLEEALVLGRMEGIDGVWGDLCRNYADMVREVFMLRLGEEFAQDKLARGFPEVMLHDLVHLFAPGESQFVVTLSKQLELHAGEAESASAVNVMFWKYTLSYLHAVGLTGYQRLAYASGLVRQLAEQGLSSELVQQAIIRADQAMEMLSAGPDQQTGQQLENEEKTQAVSTKPANEFYQQLLRRLSGQDQSRELVQELFDLANDYPETLKYFYRLASDYPETLKYLYRQLQEREVGVFVTVLSAHEARQHIEAFIIQKHGSMGIYFQSEIEAHARKAKNEQRYYQNVLEKLINNEIVDLEAAMGEVQQEAVPEGKSPAEAGAEEAALVEAGGFRSRLESAMVQGNAGEISGIWEDLRLNHAEMIREAFTRRMGDESARKKLAEGFPEAMLLDLIGLLAPEENRFIATLARQPELQGGQTKAGDIKNDLLQVLWKRTLAYLHALGSGRFDRVEYLRGLIYGMADQGLGNAALQQIISRVDPALGKTLDEFVAGTGAHETLERKAEIPRADELYEHLKRRLSGSERQAGVAQDLAQAIEELSVHYPETLARLYRQLQANVAGLSAGEARQLTISLVGLNQDGKETGFKRAIEEHARKAQSERRYYQHILEKLIRNQIVDLEEAMGEAQEKTLPDGKALAETGTEKTVLLEAGGFRSRLESALVQGNAGKIRGSWDEICQSHADLVREIFARRMGDESLRKKLAEGFPEAMLLDLIGLLAPEENRFIETLARQPELQGGQTKAGDIKNDLLQALWKRTLAYLHALGSGSFDRVEYLRGLISGMADQGLGNAALQQIISRVDPALGKTLDEFVAGTGAHETLERKAEIPRADELYEHLKRHLSGSERQAGVAQDLAQAIEELSVHYPETLARLYRQLQAGEMPANVAGLSAGEARQLTISLVGLNQDGKETGFKRAIEEHARKAQSERRYYQHILEKLIRNQIVDLEEAMGEAQEKTLPDGKALAKAGTEKALPGHKEMTPGVEKNNRLSIEVKPEFAPAPITSSTRDVNKRDDIGEGAEEIYIANAGMVLVSPYLPQLFRMLNLLEDSKFKDEKTTERAIHLLQFTVNESCDSPEFLLPLNKILCGVATGVPIAREIELFAQEKEAIEGMLAAIIRNWTIIGNTSVQGLRESFLQRGGRLQLRGDSWHLKVEKKGIDVLLDRLPWSFSVIRHAWMTRPVYVEWNK